jgi:hypothetical protein
MPTRRTGKGTVAIIGDDGTRAGQTPQTTDRDLTAKEVAELKSLLARARTTTGVKIKPSDTDPSEFAIDHPDRVVGSALLMQAIGTRDSDFLHGLMSQLVAVNDECGQADIHRINFMLSVIKGLKPKNQLVAMLGAQMAAVHLVMMAYARRMLASENCIEQDTAEGAFNRLARTFSAQVECLQSCQASGPQIVQNVAIGEGGRAIVANVNQPPNESMPPGVVAPEPPTGETTVIPLALKRRAIERLSTIPPRRKAK